MRACEFKKRSSRYQSERKDANDDALSNTSGYSESSLRTTKLEQAYVRTLGSQPIDEGTVQNDSIVNSIAREILARIGTNERKLQGGKTKRPSV